MNFQTADNMLNNFNETNPLATIVAVLAVSNEDTAWEHTLYGTELSIIWNGKALEMADEADIRHPIKPTTAMEQQLHGSAEGFYAYRVW